MGIFDKNNKSYQINANNYYQGNDHGDYQFVSLQDIIQQFCLMYVGEDKLIPKIKKIDVGFYAQRALQELSFDTFKSIKSQQIDVPNSLIMTLPMDYVSYTKISSVDSAGIKHPLYPTKHTSNPFQIKQNEDNSYYFGIQGAFLEETNIVKNNQFDDPFTGNWQVSPAARNGSWNNFRLAASGKYYVEHNEDTITRSGGELNFNALWNTGYGAPTRRSRAYGAWQKLDVSNTDIIDLKATATSGAQLFNASSTLMCDFGIIRVGLTTLDPATQLVNENGVVKDGYATNPGGPNVSPHYNIGNYNVLDPDGNVAVLEWNDGTTEYKTIENINITGITDLWVYVQSFSPWNDDAVTTLTQGVFNGGLTQPLPNTSENNTPQTNSLDFVSVVTEGQNKNLTEASANGNSSTWQNYKSHDPSENNISDYRDYNNHIYWPNEGERYGLDPAHAQVNGSFYIDDRLGKIHFSSNISGKTIILDYLSDSLGTNEEMKVHKFAEDAMYKWLLHAILSTYTYSQALVPRLTKEKFAAVRKAKLRLSGIKLEEITQILRGKSKQIKH